MNLHVGTRKYAEAIASLIDPKGNLFSGRMVSRSDVPNDSSGGLDKSLHVRKSSRLRLRLQLQ